MKSVYVIAQERGPVKVGISDKPMFRLRSLQTGHASRLDLKHSREADNAKLVERLAHHALREKRLSGEWFDVTVDEAIAAIESAVIAMASV